MVRITFRFDRAKALESILYLSKRVCDSDIYGICKLLYLVDKTSLEKYGRFVFGETYCALKEGATPSHAYDLLKKAEETPIEGLEIRGNQVIALRDANLEYLSVSDVECLDQVISQWGKAPYWVRRQAAHDEAYQQAWSHRGHKDSVKIPVESIAELVDDSGDLISYLSNADDE